MCFEKWQSKRINSGGLRIKNIKPPREKKRCDTQKISVRTDFYPMEVTPLEDRTLILTGVIPDLLTQQLEGSRSNVG